MSLGNTGRTIWGLVGVGTFGIPNITQTTLNRKDNKYILVTTRLHHTPDVQV
jgi:hydroxylamine reductase (hybrid-cluster protein)